MVIKSIKNCARCGNDHLNIDAEQFKRAVINHDALTPNEQILYNYWALCPNVRQPILIKVTIEETK